MNNYVIPDAAGENAAMNSMGASFVLVLVLVFFAGIIVLQVFLSKKENKWLGLILPIISLCISLITVFNITAFTAVTVSTTASSSDIVLYEHGFAELQDTPEIYETRRIFPTSSLVFSVVSIFLIYNIPTIVLMTIYAACREKQRQKKALEKMQAQDLG